MVKSALTGELDKRIDTNGKAGFFANLSDGMNQLMGVNEQVIVDSQRVLSAISRGDLTETIETDYEGAYDRLKQDINATVAQLKEVIGKVKSSSLVISDSSRQLLGVNSALNTTAQEGASLAGTASDAAKKVKQTVQCSRLLETLQNETGYTETVFNGCLIRYDLRC